MPLKLSLTIYLFKVVMLLWRKNIQRKLVVVERISSKVILGEKSWLYRSNLCLNRGEGIQNLYQSQIAALCLASCRGPAVRGKLRRDHAWRDSPQSCSRLLSVMQPLLPEASYYFFRELIIISPFRSYLWPIINHCKHKIQNNEK